MWRVWRPSTACPSKTCRPRRSAPGWTGETERGRRPRLVPVDPAFPGPLVPYAFLPHHRHRLREQPAAPRHGLREDHRRRHRPLPAAARRRHLLPHGQRRALAERVQARAGAGHGSAGLLRRDGAGVPRGRGPASTSRSTTSSAPPSRATRRPCRRMAQASATPATSTRATTRAGTASAARRSSRRRTSSTGCARSTRRSRTGSRRRTTSSGCRSTSSRCSSTTPRIPAFLEPEMRRNEILRLVEGGLEDISMSRAGQSWGIPLPFDPKSVVYVWFDALINYAAAVGYGWDDALDSRRGGRPTCTSSARTSRASTASSGRRC